MTLSAPPIPVNSPCPRSSVARSFFYNGSITTAGGIVHAERDRAYSVATHRCCRLAITAGPSVCPMSRRARDGGIREKLAAGVAATLSKCCTLARCLTCETLGHARAHRCRPLISRFVATRVRHGRRKHWLPRSSPIASIHRARPRGRERAAIKSIAFIRRAAIPNQRTARALGIKFPAGVLALADEVIE